MGFGIFVSGVFLLLVGVCLRFIAARAIKKPPVHDGIGGEDTKNLLKGCMGMMAYELLLFLAFLLMVVGGTIWILEINHVF